MYKITPYAKETSARSKSMDTYHQRSRKGENNLICKCITIIDPAIGWFEIHQYDDKRKITVANIAEQECLSRNHLHKKLTYNRGSVQYADFQGEKEITLLTL
jgi:AraC-like DNA-binding protein